jgi:hypothetical protein
MSTGDQTLASARARRREMALDPQDLAARDAGYPDLRSKDNRGKPSRRTVITRVAIGAVILGAVLVGALALWNSGAGSTARDELRSARTELTGLARTQTGGAGAEASPVSGERPAILASIVGTDGRGVAVRDACTAEARTGGVILEGATVTVLERGLDACSGWSLVESEGATSWVDNSFLDVAPLSTTATD